MNSKNIKAHLRKVINEWADSITDKELSEGVRNNVLVTGGALVSLLTGDKVNDYDIYFREKWICERVAQYYVDKWKAEHDGYDIEVKENPKTGAIQCFIRSEGIVENPEEMHNSNDIDLEESESVESGSDKSGKKKEKYAVRFITSNAITLSNKIQLVTRFYGDAAEIHKNFDFAHCTCAWQSWNNELLLPTKALECIINKELYYVGSKYPLCSIIRTRKYLERGYHINAGQYVKMAMQLNELDLTDVDVLEDQLTGVDTLYFAMMIGCIKKKLETSDGEQKVDSSYVIELINKLF